MIANPFTNMFRYKTARDPIQAIQCIGHKIIDDSDSATFGMEYPRQILIDYFGPENRNSEFDLDTSKFYFYQYKDASGITVNFWLCVTLTENVVQDMSYVMPDQNTRLYIISKGSVDISETTIKTCNLLMRFYSMAIGDFVSGRKAYMVGSGQASNHIIANYLYRAFDIDLSNKENFDKTLVNHCSPMFSENMYEFFKADFAYCNTIAREDLNFSKVIGTNYRYNVLYGRDSEFIHLSGNKVVKKDDTVDPEHSTFDMDFPLTFEDVDTLTSIAVNSAGWSLACINYDYDDLDSVRIGLNSIIMSPNNNNIDDADVFKYCVIATTGFAIASKSSNDDVSDMYTGENLKRLIEYIKCLDKVVGNDVDLVKLFFAKLRAILFLDDISSVYYCTLLDSIVADYKTMLTFKTIDPTSASYIAIIRILNDLIENTVKNIDIDSGLEDIFEVGEVDLATFLFNFYTPISSEDTPWKIGADYCISSINLLEQLCNGDINNE